MKSKSFLLGFFFGGAAAGITVLLYAPASGKESSKYLRKNLNNLKENISEMNNSLLELLRTVQTASKEGKEEISAFITDVKELVTGWQQDIRPHQELIKEELNEIQKSLAELEEKVLKDNLNKSK